MNFACAWFLPAQWCAALPSPQDKGKKGKLAAHVAEGEAHLGEIATLLDAGMGEGVGAGRLPHLAREMHVRAEDR